MFTRKLPALVCALVIGAGAAHAADSPNLGTPVTNADIAAWDISVLPDGRGLQHQLALGEIASAPEAAVCRDWSLHSGVASTSAGVELLRNEIVVLGNAAGWVGDLVIGHGVMRDAIDAEAAMPGAAMRRLPEKRWRMKTKAV